MTTHEYRTTLQWAGSTGAGYRSYSREHSVALTPTTNLALSADAAFRGDAQLANPEQLLVAAASSCQMLSFLSAAARSGVDVVAYDDAANGEMPEAAASMSMTEIELRPVIRVRNAGVDEVEDLVVQAHHTCYIANSLRSEVRVTPTIHVVP
ncbi:OsmC family protein [Zhihengliuella halotolerans]|uniref:Organic hydroperoxide reductase OsmC/OhrA n=1 Tax=Zhihengliuella halotolerans TaxID=370736 RepID=A0A4Q8AA41_9MICC|nr:OsmC family protein [Zhihengliuella halotolerans]RZU60962.1 organic hydroperoxide reductase OsmC/OhrA [Zhihengliuella halotolerans]